MKILISGASGLIGSALRPQLVQRGDQVTRLIRGGEQTSDAIVWDPRRRSLDAARLEGFDAVIHLAGENLASGRWTAARKEEIRASRALGTRLLSETLARLDRRRPNVLVSASAIGIYGDRGDEILTEDSPPGTGFLADVCREWEAATAPAREQGIRVVNLRTGVVLSKDGGALKKMLTPFKLGLGGKIGSGRQYLSWVGIDDTTRIILHALDTASLAGPLNVVADAVTNLEFTRTLGRVLGRPTFFAMPAAAARLAFGEMADEALLASTRVAPRKLRDSGYAFAQPSLEECLRRVLGR